MWSAAALGCGENSASPLPDAYNLPAVNFQPFELEYFQSRFERTVEYNLADSSVKCANASDLLAGEDPSAVTKLPLYYPEVNGTVLLRERIAALYPSATPSNVLVTVGAAEANLIIAGTLLEPGDDVVVISPGYRQIWGLARSAGCRVHEVHLRPENNWRLDVDELESVAGARTKLIHSQSQQSDGYRPVLPGDAADRQHLCQIRRVAARG